MSTAILPTAVLARPYNMRYLWRICLVAALGGLLFGYDWVVIGGAKPFYEAYFHLTSSAQIGWAMSCALIGCLFGAVLSGALSDRFGRRRLLLFSGLVFAASSVGTGLADSFTLFIFNRIAGGVAIGLASSLSPMYIAEVSPAEVRGKFVSINQLTIVIGVAAAQIVNWRIAHAIPMGASSLDILNSWNGQEGWRWMFAATAIPSLFFYVCTLFVPESPRWLAKDGKHEKASTVLGSIGGQDYARRELQQIEETLKAEAEKFEARELFDPRIRTILVLGIVLAVFQQWCGINVIFNYAEEVFKAAGYTVSAILFNIVVTGLTMLVFTFIAIYTVDKIGRRLLMQVGAAGLMLTYLALGYCFYSHITGIIDLVLVMAAIACYSFSLAPVTWVILSEIFPNRIRGAAMSVAVFALWAGCFTLTYTFPLLNHSLGSAGTFWLYGAICLAGLLFITARLPETKGKSLEEIEIALVGADVTVPALEAAR